MPATWTNAHPLHRSEREGKRERERDKETEREGEREKEIGMTGALAPFSYLVT